MSQQPEPTRKGFISPLQKAQAGKIGGGRSSSAPTSEPETRPAPAQTPTPAAAAEPEQASEKKLTTKDTHFRQTVWMPKQLNHRLKMIATRDHEDVSGIINRLVEKYLDEVEG